VALISTEEAAKRLARVILSDIELYSRERPQAGENLAARIEEGRRLFGSRVSPDVLPLFDVVLADRRTTGPGGRAPVAAVISAMRVGPIAVDRSLDDQAPTPGPLALALAEEPTPAPARPVPARVPAPVPAPVRSLELRNAAPPVPVPDTTSLAPIAHVQVGAPPPPVAVASVPSPASLTAAVSDTPVPVLTSRISVWKVLALVAAVASAFGLLCRFVR
jgi:hypothetical protein